MGSLVLAGAVEGLGKGMAANVVQRSAREEKNLDRQHDKALQRMRESGMSRLQEDRQSEQRDIYDKTKDDAAALLTGERKHQAGLLTGERAHEAGLLEGVQTREDTVTEDKQQHEIFLQAMKSYDKRGKSTTLKSGDGKYEMRNVTKKVFSPENPFGAEVDELVVKLEGAAGPMEPHGTRMLPYGANEKDKALGLSEWKDANGVSGAQRQYKAESRLRESAGTDNDLRERFQAKYGYLPVSYFDELAKQSKGDFGAYLKTVMNESRRGSLLPAATPAPVVAPPTSALPPRTGMDDTTNLLPGSPGLLRMGAMQNSG